MKTIEKYYCIEKKDLCFLRFVIEACDGIAIITTIDPLQGIVKLCIPPGCESDVQTVLDSMDIHMEELHN